MKHTPSARFSVATLKRAAALSLAAAALGLSAMSMSQAQTLPTDPQMTCTVAPATFNSWFDAGHPSLNGSVKPADSINFNTTPNCNFYAWSHQMFLWLTSPAPSLYGGKGRIFNSPVFYDVSLPDKNGQRTLIPHVQRPIPIPIGTAKVGADGLPIVLDKIGRPHEVIDAPLSAKGRPVIQVAGKPVEIAAIRGEPGTKAVLLNAANKPIAASVSLNAAIVPRALIMPQARLMLLGGSKFKTETARTDFVLQHLRKASVLEAFNIAGKFTFVNLASGLVEDVEPGQAGGAGVLLAQNGSIIFYQTVVNDVYAYFLTGAKNGAISPSAQFPTTLAQANQIVAYALAHGKKIVDPEALAIEAKLSWIEVTPNLPNPGSYVTTQAIIPVYDTSNPNLWKPVSTKVTTLALVGAHVVGSTAGHPEMLWGTFEHFGNTPFATYQYNSTSGPNPKTVNQNTAGVWLFAANGAGGTFNQAHANFLAPPNIQSASGFTISPSNTLHEKPFGTAFNQTSNPVDATPAAANTELIALNVNIASMMTAGGAGSDVRNNYFQSGTTWTAGGAPPSGSFPAGNEVGTSLLSNSTMETYHQGPDNNNNGLNCFSCHQTNTTSVSHMYPVLKPLF